MKNILDLSGLFGKKPTGYKEVDIVKKVRNQKKHPHAFGGFRERNLQAIFIPRRTHFKGYMRENRRSTFNKNK